MIRTLGCLPALIRPPFRCSTVPLQARARNGTTTATLRVIYPATNLGPGRATQQEPLYLTLELTNPVTRLAVQIQTKDYHMVGWAPRYLVRDLTEAMAGTAEYSARVVRLNPLPAPSKQRVLIEMHGRWRDHQPMSNEDFRPLVDRSGSVAPG